MREPGTPMTEAAKSVVAPPVRAAGSGGASPASESGSPTARRRDVTWEDPLVSAALARDLVVEPRPAQEQPAQEQPAQEKGPSGRSAENGHGR